MKIIKLPWLKFKKMYPIVSFFKHCSMKITPSSPQIKKKHKQNLNMIFLQNSDYKFAIHIHILSIDVIYKWFYVVHTCNAIRKKIGNLTRDFLWRSRPVVGVRYPNRPQFSPHIFPYASLFLKSVFESFLIFTEILENHVH